MGKAELMAIGTILKVLLGLIGIVLTLVLLILGLVKKDNKKLKRAGLVFVMTVGISILLSAIEMIFLVNL
jgi:hypothetical protein